MPQRAAAVPTWGGVGSALQKRQALGGCLGALLRGVPAAGARGFARLAPPRADGLGGDRLADEDEELRDIMEEPWETASMMALAPMAAAHHKHAAAGWADGPLPLEAGGEDSINAPPPPIMPSDRNQRLREPLPEVRGHKAQMGLLQRLAALERREAPEQSGQRAGGRASASPGGRRRRGQFEFADDQPIRIRVLDVDAIDLKELHHAFAFTLVRRLPAEICMRVASRLAAFRDNFQHQAYENLLRDCSKLFGPTHGPELIALFARCHSTIAVPFLIDYTRRYGTFSRKFIAAQVDQSLQPALFDFIRYQDKGSVRPLPLVVSKPWALGAYTRLMGKSYMRTKLFEQLKVHGFVPPEQLAADTDENMPVEARAAERLSAVGALAVPGPRTAREQKNQQRTRWKAEEAEPRRPELLDAVMEAEYTGRGWDPSDAEAVRAAAKAAKARKRRAETLIEAASGQMEVTKLRQSSGKDGPTALSAPSKGQPAWPDGAPFSDNSDDEDLGLPGLESEGRSRSASPLRAGGAAGKEADEDADRPDRFGMQFEYVVPDSVADPEDGAITQFKGSGRDAGAGQDTDSLETLPERFWSKSRRPFFRHMHKAYRLIEEKWQKVPDPRGPRHEPKRRHRSREDLKEQRLHGQMRSRGQRRASTGD